MQHKLTKKKKIWKTCVNIKKSVHLVTWVVLFLLCVPKKGVYKWGSLRTAPLEWSLCTRQHKRQKKKQSCKESLAPLQSQPANRHPQFSLKGSRRALSQKEIKRTRLPTLFKFISYQQQEVYLVNKFFPFLIWWPDSFPPFSSHWMAHVTPQETLCRMVVEWLFGNPGEIKAKPPSRGKKNPILIKKYCPISDSKLHSGLKWVFEEVHTGGTTDLWAPPLCWLIYISTSISSTAL